jgi:hypothetical protein
MSLRFMSPAVSSSSCSSFEAFVPPWNWRIVVSMPPRLRYFEKSLVRLLSRRRRARKRIRHSSMRLVGDQM